MCFMPLKLEGLATSVDRANLMRDELRRLRYHNIVRGPRVPLAQSMWTEPAIIAALQSTWSTLVDGNLLTPQLWGFTALASRGQIDEWQQRLAQVTDAYVQVEFTFDGRRRTFCPFAVGPPCCAMGKFSKCKDLHTHLA